MDEFYWSSFSNTESMCKVRSYEVKAVFHLGILFGIFTEGLKELNIKLLLNFSCIWVLNLLELFKISYLVK